MADRSSSEIPVVPEQSAAARELLRAFKQHESPSADEREARLVALHTRLHADEPAPAANGRVYSIARATVVTVAVAAAVLLAIKAVGSGVTALADRARQPAVEAPYHGEAGSDGGQAVARTPRILPPRRSDGAPAGTPAVIDPSAQAPVAPEAVTPDSTARDTAGSEPSSSAARPSRSRSSASTSAPVPADEAADALAAELALIKRATEAKKDQRWADGLAALREHGQQFPRGVLADERRVLKAELHCAAGRVQEADALVEAFLREHPGSALAGRMRNVCRD
jgi:TolA-binding protein